ncbi:MAG: serine hydrolase domain-containing protein [Bacteroidota bacterium]
MRRPLAFLLPVCLVLPILAAAAQPASLASLDAIIDEAHEAGTFDGVVLVARGDSVIYRRAVGLADRESGRSYTPDTPQPWASITKQLTAVLMLQLVDEGHLTLSTPLSEVFPSARADGAGRVTMRHLLMNSSGLPTDLRQDDESALKRLLAAKLSFEPGSKFQYSNIDYLVLGQVIEAVTGQAYEDALQARVLDPLGMQGTALVHADQADPGLATGYLSGRRNRVRAVPPTRVAAFGAAGALAGPADDLFRFNRALLTDQLFPRALRDTMFTGDPALGYVGLSVWPYPRAVGDQRVMLIERQGFIEGYRGLNLLAPDEDLMLIVLANTNRADLSQTYATDGFSYQLLRAALQRSSESAP